MLLLFRFASVGKIGAASSCSISASVEYIVGLLRDAGESESTAFRLFAPLVSAPRGSCCLRGLMDRREVSLLYLACPTLWREVSEISAPWGREAATFRKRRRHPCLSKRSMIYTS